MICSCAQYRRDVLPIYLVAPQIIQPSVMDAQMSIVLPTILKQEPHPERHATVMTDVAADVIRLMKAHGLVSAGDLELA